MLRKESKSIINQRSYFENINSESSLSKYKQYESEMKTNRHAQQSRKRTYNTQQTYPSQTNYESESDKMQSTQKKSNYDEQFAIIYEQIIRHEYFSKITKHQKIRINKWLTKLSNISTNDLWKKNRNNYIKLIRLMFDCQIIIAPFQMMPPERDLHKLTPHQINVIIDQVDKLLDQRETKDNITRTNTQQKISKLKWTQQSAYINHQNSSIQKYKDTQSEKLTNASSSITANLSKITQNTLPRNNIPTKHPSTTKHKSTQKQCMNQQNYFIKRSLQNQNNNDIKKYFIRKQRIDTFQTEQIGQQDYLTMMKNSSLEKRSPVLEKNFYRIKEHEQTNFQGQSREAINILKCGFKLLQKIPFQSLESNSLQQMQTFRRILSQNQFLKCQFLKENTFLQQLTNRGTHRNDKPLQDIYDSNNTQKSKVTEKKKKLTLLSQSSIKI